MKGPGRRTRNRRWAVEVAWQASARDPRPKSPTREISLAGMVPTLTPGQTSTLPSLALSRLLVSSVTWQHYRMRLSPLTLLNPTLVHH